MILFLICGGNVEFWVCFLVDLWVWGFGLVGFGVSWVGVFVFMFGLWGTVGVFARVYSGTCRSLVN